MTPDAAAGIGGSRYIGKRPCETCGTETNHYQVSPDRDPKCARHPPEGK